MKNTKKELFSYQSNFSFFGWCPKFHFFDNLAQKAAPKKHYKKGVSARFFLNIRCASRNGHFWTKRPKTRNSGYHLFFAFFFFFSTTKTTQISWNPYFDSVLASLRREFSKFKLKTQKFEKPHFCTLVLKKAIFRKLANNWTQKKHKMITEQTKSLEPPIFIVRKWPWPS